MGWTGERFDVAVIGAGLVGLATARALVALRPESSVGVLEKESAVAAHQSSHNSGVVHSGIYYAPGSLKARLCLLGRRLLLEFAAERGIRTRAVGKLIVATRVKELGALDRLEQQALGNGISDVRRIDRTELERQAPGVAGVAATEVPSAAIIDYPAVARAVAAELNGHGGVRTESPLLGATRRSDGWVLETPDGNVTARYVVNCAGLECDLVARSMGIDPPISIVPFRGDFYRLGEPVRSAIRRLIYPTPDPRVPFLGVHLTPTVDGELLAGPNAALALHREGYGRGSIDARELARLSAFPGTFAMLRRYGGLAARETLRSWGRAEFLAAIRRLYPSVSAHALGARSSGVRAQAVRRDGSMEDDFVLVRGPASLHVLNAPSPAATAAFAIGERVASEAGFGPT